MRTIKKLVLALSFVAICLTGLMGCQDTETENSLTANSELQKFRNSGHLYDQAAVVKYYNNGSLGTKPENALVPLIFHKDGRLYSAQEFNDAVAETPAGKNIEDLFEGYSTDLITFQEITGLHEAVADYARLFPATERDVWVFDPYVKFFQTRAEIDIAFQEKVSNAISSQVSIMSVPAVPTNNPTLAAKMVAPNMMYGEFQGSTTISNYTGHTGGIVQSYQSNNNIAVLMQNTDIVEALDPSNGVIKRKMSSNGSNVWATTAMNARYLMYKTSGTTSTETNNIATFQKNQVGKSYYFPLVNAAANKLSETDWYCSKLQWKAYKTYTGFDIDSDGGSYVFPRDIALSNYINLYVF